MALLAPVGTFPRAENPLSVKRTKIFLAGLLTSLSLHTAQAQNLYGEDLVWRLANPSEIRDVTNIDAKLRRESKTAVPLFILTPPPFEEIATAPETHSASARRPGQWELPPWPTLDPALPDGLPEHLKKEYEDRRERNADAQIWSEIGVSGGIPDAPSALLRPKKVPLGEEFVFHIKEIPAPFSVRRYFDRSDVFIEVAAYGGTTSFKAEEAFRAMKEAATRHEAIQGIGSEAFLTRVIVVEPSNAPAPEALSEFDGPDMPKPPPFGDIIPTDVARPELTDSGRATALTAPAFQEVAVSDLEGKKIRYPSAVKKYISKEPEIQNSLLVIVAFFPDEAVTLSFAIEERIGSVQDLVALAMLAQRKLREDVKRG